MKALVAVVAAGMVSCSMLAFTPTSAIAVEQSASEKSSATKNKRVKRAQTMREQVFKRLEVARDLADKNQYAEALEELESLERMRRNSYEKAMTYNMVAYVHFNQEDYPGAIKAYEQLIAIDNIPESLEQNTLYSLAKLYLIGEDYKKALGPLNRWFGLVEKPSAEAYVLRAQIYFQLEQFKKALPDIKVAISEEKAKGKKPRENWLMLERAIYYQNRDFVSLARCLQDLATYYPKGQYWMQLSAVYSELGKPMKELSTLETAYDKGLLDKENQLISLVQALLSQEVPYKAARILSKGMKDGQIEDNARNLSMLGDAWMLAKEYDKAIVVMAKAAKASGKGDDYFKLAQIHTERQEWKQALTNVDNALKDNKVKNRDSVRTLKGLVLFNMDNLEAAEKVFVSLKKDRPEDRMAAQWLTYIQGEKQRRAYMAEVQ
ncbi:hypothetical protein CHH28_11650 [Bacterioplanes sanyensis]|uniref:Tetratricopeptide repeat protein n=1 Tax=Bacterioplanes sanyensis TaxID=1249553 RepID=A0A222FLM8_9GAMM|nr:tetratricopeptide repeat protein [Bacterioplanes sanyensis]ASP39291.1 hypothetical protein CHH28_11650 [Bacterioplanes sanyensis]